MVNSQFPNAVADRLAIAAIAIGKTVDSHHNSGGGFCIVKAVKPIPNQIAY
jgi:hypothetical protein